MILLLTLTSCSSLLTGVYGIHKVHTTNDLTILENSNKYKIPIEDSYVLDSSYITFLRSLDSSRYQEQIKNHYQPLQALYYDQSGQLCSFQINCYAGGIPNLRWKRDNIMSVFPPAIQAPIDSILPLVRHLQYLRPLDNKTKISAGQYDTTIIVYWSLFMGRQSKRLIRTVRENSKFAITKNIKIIYVNNDNFFASL
ncbi:MAG: hypothetical protein U0V49_01200 [Saprospiraceae bacterium]